MKQKVLEKAERIETIDILRGFFIFSIIVVHLGRFPSGYDVLTGRGILWVTNSEGFFFMSGMLIGLVMGKKAIAQPFIDVTKKLLKRGLTLYAWAFGLTLLFTAIALQSGLSTIKPYVWQGAITWEIIWQSAIFKYVYGWADFLQYYSVFLFASIPAIYALRKGKWYIVVLVSIIIWLTNGENAFRNWQLFFFCGAVAGWYWNEIITFIKKAPNWIKVIHYPLALGVLALSVVVVEGNLAPRLTEMLSPYFIRSEMPPPRVAVFALWFSAAYRFVATHEEKVKKWVGWILIPFGQNSLYVYIVHSFLIFFAWLLIPQGQNIIVNFVITTSALGLALLAVRKKFLFSVIPR